MTKRLEGRIEDLEQQRQPPRRVYVAWADGRHVSVDGVRYAVGDAPEQAERDVYIAVSGGFHGKHKQTD